MIQNRAPEIDATLVRKRQKRIPLPARKRMCGGIAVCGNNEMGQCGHFGGVMYKSLTFFGECKNTVAVAAGGFHNVILDDHGTVFTFGSNDYGALGREVSLTERESMPHPVTLPFEALRISAGDAHSACLLSNGSVYAWGDFTGIQGESLGLLLCGAMGLPTPILPDIKFVNVESGYNHIVLLANDGSVYSFGTNEYGQLGRWTHSDMPDLKKQLEFTPTKIHLPGNPRIIRMWVTPYSTFLLEAGKEILWVMGLNSHGQCLCRDDGTPYIIFPKPIQVSSIKAIAGGIYHTLLLKTTGEVYAMGKDDCGRLGTNLNADGIGNLRCIKYLEEILKVEKITCGAHSSFTLSSTGEMYSWGCNADFQLGLGNKGAIDMYVPTKIDQWRFLDVSSSCNHTIFVVEDLEMS